MTEADAIGRTGDSPNTKSSLVEDLKALGVKSGMTLLVHSSLSSLGWVCGGPVTVVQALQEVLGEAGTLVMPTHTSENTDPAVWCNPPVPQSWWQTIRDEMPAYDPQLTPTRAMGDIPECFRTQSSVVRSPHPQHSFAARGPDAEHICGQHPLAFSMGEDSPLARIYELRGHVLLLGVDHDRNTSFHLGEYRALAARGQSTTCGAATMVDGQRQWVTFQDIEYDDADFLRQGRAFDETSGTTMGKVGAANARLFSQPIAVDFAESWITKERQ
jgi:aminoglycoside 3-N-acetyltransferase